MVAITEIDEELRERNVFDGIEELRKVDCGADEDEPERTTRNGLQWMSKHCVWRKNRSLYQVAIR